MSDSLQGRYALISGGGSGIGKAIASSFVSEGAHVLICGRTISTLEETANEMNLLFHEVDVSNSDSIKDLADFIIKEGWGSLDILVNNAGIFKNNSVETCTEAEWDNVIDTNLKGTYLMSNAFIPMMSKGSSILNISSNLGLRALDNAAAYCAAKAGVVNLTRSMALDLAKRIRVNCICPGIVETPMVTNRVNKDSIEYDNLSKIPALKRLGKPEEIASMALHLCSSDAKWTTGSIITVDGGQTAD